MKTLLFIFAVVAAFSTETLASIDCYDCTYVKSGNDLSGEVLPSAFSGLTDTECEKPKETDTGIMTSCNSTDTDYCTYRVVKITGKYDGESVKYTFYTRTCDSDADDELHNTCDDSVSINTAPYESDGNFTDIDGSSNGLCYCNNKDLCNSNSASYMTGSLVALISAAILRFAL